MKRRKFIQNSALTTIGLMTFPHIGLGKNNITSKLSFEWVSTAFTIVKMGISLSQMFSGNSSSIEDLLKIQTEILNNISKKLDLIQEGLEIIIKDIIEVKKLVGEIPLKVIEVYSEKKMQSNVSDFHEEMKTYSNYADKTEYVKNQKKEIEDLLKKIRDDFYILESNNNYLNVPLMSTALYMEFNLMKLIGEREERIKPAIERYKNYFSKMLYDNEIGLEVKINSIRENRKKWINDSNIIKLIETKGACVDRCWTIIGYYSYTSFIDFNYEENRVNELVQLGLIENNERVHKTQFKTESRSVQGVLTENAESAYKHLGQLPAQNRERRNVRNMADYNTLIHDKKNGAIQKLKELEENIKLETLKLYTAVSCMHAGNRALNFCNSNLA